MNSAHIFQTIKNDSQLHAHTLHTRLPGQTNLFFACGPIADGTNRLPAASDGCLQAAAAGRE